MGRRTKADELGLTMVTESIHKGNWRVRLMTDSGAVLLDKDGYLSEHGARAGASRYLRENYATPVADDPPVEATEPAPSAKPRETQVDVWQRRIQKEADDMEAKAIDLREKANTLEDEAKRLRAAADVLAN